MVPGTEDSPLAALSALFELTGLEEIATRTIDVTLTFADFNDFWRAQTPNFNPLAKIIAALPEIDRARLVELVRARFPAGSDGSIAYTARANVIKARVPI